MSVVLPPLFTIFDQLEACGTYNVDLFDSDTLAQRLAEQIFNDDYNIYMDKSFEKLEQNFKSYARLTVTEGRIRLLPGIKRSIKAFINV